MKVGEIYKACPELLALEVEQKHKRYKAIPGTVVYVHPEGRFVVLEFQFKNFAVRESFRTLTEREKDELCGPLQS